MMYTTVASIMRAVRGGISNDGEPGNNEQSRYYIHFYIRCVCLQTTRNVWMMMMIDASNNFILCNSSELFWVSQLIGTDIIIIFCQFKYIVIVFVHYCFHILHASDCCWYITGDMGFDGSTGMMQDGHLDDSLYKSADSVSCFLLDGTESAAAAANGEHEAMNELTCLKFL